MRDRYQITLEIETLDGDPGDWNWGALLNKASCDYKIIESSYKGRVLPTNERENNE